MRTMPATPLRDLLVCVIETFEPVYYRLGTFFAMSILDDPAMLAFAFC
ncbi:MAG: hypothetical protein NT123_19690 [Proteobacteria bacterium]|nr:hypothetical protein [Pseudomonadota bacterium]